MKKKKFVKIGKAVINLEIKALNKLKNSISNSFNLAVEQIVKCQSKVILCGVGKSGLIANKIAATFSSVGTPSFYLSASDSSHGDLGSISKKDVLILISYSGKTSELKNIIQYTNRNKIMLIGIMSKKDSILGIKEGFSSPLTVKLKVKSLDFLKEIMNFLNKNENYNRRDIYVQ